VVIDAGHKAVSSDSGFPEVCGLTGAKYHKPSDEHGILDLTECRTRLALGDKLLLIPGHCDPTVNLHDWYVGVRGLHTADACVEAVWPVAARGAVF
jgi:3-hydroxy-D-aspartate aldolase